MLYTGVVNNGLSPLYSKKVILILSNIMEDIPILLYAKNKKKSIDTFFFTITTFSTLKRKFEEKLQNIIYNNITFGVLVN